MISHILKYRLGLTWAEFGNILISNVVYMNTAKCCNIYSVTKCYKSTVFQKCRLCTISIQTKLTTRWQDCLGNYNCILTESDIQHYVVTCNCIYVQINSIYLWKIALFLKLNKPQICFNSKYVNIDLDCRINQATAKFSKKACLLLYISIIKW